MSEAELLAIASQGAKVIDAEQIDALEYLIDDNQSLIFERSNNQTCRAVVDVRARAGRWAPRTVLLKVVVAELLQFV